MADETEPDARFKDDPRIKMLMAKYRISKEVAEAVVGEVEDTAPSLMDWKHGNAKEYYQFATLVGGTVNDSAEFERLGKEQYEEIRAREAERQAKIELRRLETMAAKQERYNEAVKYAEATYGDGSEEYRRAVQSAESKMQENVPIDFKSIVEVTKNMNTGKKIIDDIMGCRARTERRLVTGEEAIESEGIRGPKRKERLIAKDERFQRPFYDQHRVRFECRPFDDSNKKKKK